MKQVFAGPVSESVPTSIAAFSHRRSRAGSSASFTYFQEPEQPADWADEEAIMDGADDDRSPVLSEIEVSFEELTPAGRRRSSVLSRGSAQDPLLSGDPLARVDSVGPAEGGRKSQKIYILTEDLTIVIAGFSTHPVRALLYYALCIVTLGAAYLLCHWLPRWRVALLGRPTPLRDCSWVVIEVS